MPIQFLNCASMAPWWPRWQVGGVCLLVRHAWRLFFEDEPQAAPTYE